MDVNALKPAMRDTLRERGHSDQAIALMSPREAFDEYCTWHGIILGATPFGSRQLH